MAQAMLDNKNKYEQQIQYLQAHGDILLERIKVLEIKMNQKKQRNKQTNERDINSMNCMVKKLLQWLAQINTYQFFENTNKPFCHVNGIYFYEICNTQFESLIRTFIKKLQFKRLRRLQRLKRQQRFHYFNEPVDFQICQ